MEFLTTSLLTSFLTTKLAILSVPVITVFKPSLDLPIKFSNNFLLSNILPSGNLTSFILDKFAPNVLPVAVFWYVVNLDASSIAPANESVNNLGISLKNIPEFCFKLNPFSSVALLYILWTILNALSSVKGAPKASSA